MKISPWSERGLSSVSRLWIRSLKFDLLYIRYHSRYDVGLDTDTENSLLLGVRFSSIKFAQQNIWQNLCKLVVIRLKFWLWRVFHSVDLLTAKTWFCKVLERIWCQITITPSCWLTELFSSSDFWILYQHCEENIYSFDYVCK